MMQHPPDTVLNAYGLINRQVTVAPVGSGLINHTWKITCDDEAYILQRINHHVFTHPEAIADNIDKIGAYLAEHVPEYLFTHPVRGVTGNSMMMIPGEGYFRLFNYIPDSYTIDVVQTPDQAFEAAYQFGKFTHLLSGFDSNQLQETIHRFHDLTFRYQEFERAVESGDGKRKKHAGKWIDDIVSAKHILQTYQSVLNDPSFRKRVTHHDTKISNVLFNHAGKGICVIDLDTVMPGYFISDVGDMFRTYLSPVSEEEQDLSKIQVRKEMYEAIVSGYSHAMKNDLTERERNSFFFAACFLVYMQAIRFLTDYLNIDKYYQIQYPEHNLNRAINQLCLLDHLMKMQKELSNYKP